MSVDFFTRRQRSSLGAASKESISEKNNAPLVIVIAGPTGVGKSAVAASLCGANRASKILCSNGNTDAVGHIVSADSVQAYNGVQVGANKPTEEERNMTPHHLIDIVDANNYAYNAAEWMEDAILVVNDLVGRCPLEGTDADGSKDGRTQERRENIRKNMHAVMQSGGENTGQPILPVVVGGTMMYLQWLVHGRPDAPRPSAEALEKAATVLSKFRSSDSSSTLSDGTKTSSPGWDAAVNHVSSLGPLFKARVDKLYGNDWYRLRRILEVGYTVEGGNATDDQINALYSGQRYGGIGTLGFDVRCFFLCPDDRMKHAELIDKRCEDMILRGLLRETTDLSLSGGLPDNGQPARAIGYRQALDYLRRKDAKNEDADTLNGFMDNFAAVTRRYAKKQMQWFRRDKSFLFVPVSLSESPDNRIEDAADIILSMCLLSREDYEKELYSPDAKDVNEVQGGSLPLSAKTKLENENQAKGMKFFIGKRHKIIEGTAEYGGVIREADACTKQMQEFLDLLERAET